MVQNGPKWSQIVQNGQKLSKLFKMVKNGGPDLKWAQHTGLSDQRAQTTKGPPAS